MKNIDFKNTILNIIACSLYLLKILGSITIIIFLVYLFLHTTDTITRIILIPFFICGFTIFGALIAKFFRKVNLEVLFHKLYTVGFLLFWFGVLVLGCYLSLINREYQMIIFTIPFWLVGIYMVYKNFIKK